MGKGTEGWIALHRQVRAHWLWKEKPYHPAMAWEDMLFRARFKECQWHTGKEAIVVERGQFVANERELAESWGWSRGRVRKFLPKLEKDQMLILKRIHNGTLFTVVKFEEYNGLIDERETAALVKRSTVGSTEDPQRIHKEELNNDLSTSLKQGSERVMLTTQEQEQLPAILAGARTRFNVPDNVPLTVDGYLRFYAKRKANGWRPKNGKTDFDSLNGWALKVFVGEVLDDEITRQKAERVKPRPKPQTFSPPEPTHAASRASARDINRRQRPATLAKIKPGEMTELLDQKTATIKKASEK